MNITPRFAAADISRKLDDSNSVRNIDLLSGAGEVIKIDGAVTSCQARKWSLQNKAIECAYCGRKRFSTPQPHNCNSGGLRKRRLRWFLLNVAKGST
jgi:DNA replicative helicase MCM subunit Mcm2 (Cdc46/Mcm family)